MGCSVECWFVGDDSMDEKWCVDGSRGICRQRSLWGGGCGAT